MYMKKGEDEVAIERMREALEIYRKIEGNLGVGSACRFFLVNLFSSHLPICSDEIIHHQ
jgi:hypothetical protein